VPDAHIKGKFHAPMMFTTDIALIKDPEYAKISKHFYENPVEFDEAFAKAWFKLTHRDMGPTSRYLGSMAPKEEFLWQDPIPAVDYKLIDNQDVASLKKKILDSGLSIPQLVSTAWASASTFRGSDMRGGANGARIRLEPQKNWEVNDPAALAKVLDTLEGIQEEFNKSASGGKKVSLADIIVLGGCTAVEEAAKKGGHDIKVPFSPGRNDTTQEMTDVDSFSYLEPTSDGFRNFQGSGEDRPGPELLIDRANLLNLTVPEMTVLVGGMRALNANTGQTQLGVLTKTPETLTNDFFVNLLDLNTTWEKSPDCDYHFIGSDYASGEKKWEATDVDLVFGSNSELRAVAEVYGSEDAKDKFVNDFVAAWNKVMNLDRFDLS
ncbi:MAG: catalase-peroxidase, partial [Candidatus Omnitrophica bacterium]|nr:catalase-peroxidase [Candidatus Omnitrophota bacterium]